jgi:hypothetical protein
MKNTVIIFLSLFLISFYSCKKHDKNLTQNDADLGNVMSLDNPPAVSNGMLVFQDETHYDDWLDYLDNLVTRDSTSTDTTTTDSLLKAVEIELGFNSLRKKVNKDFEELNETGWSSTADIPEKHFIHDDIVLSTLNENGEVKIGNDIIIYFDQLHNIIVHDANILGTVRNFVNGAATNPYEIFVFDGSIVQGVTADVQGFDFVVPYNESIAMAKLSGNDAAQFWGSATTDPCEKKKIYLKNYYVQYAFSNTVPSLSWSINWGDGQTTPGGTTQFLNISHTYANHGTYTLKIEGTVPNTNPADKYEWANIKVTTGKCNNGSRSTGDVWYYTPDGMRAVRCYASVTVGGPNRVWAESEAFRWQGGKFRREKADMLYARICAEVLKENDCTSDFNTCPSTTHSNDAFVSCGHNVKKVFGWEVVYSKHSIKHNGSWYEHDFNISPCD